MTTTNVLPLPVLLHSMVARSRTGIWTEFLILMTSVRISRVLEDNGGCPKIENAKFNTQRIQFVTGSATLTAASKTMIKEGAKLLNSEDFKNLKVEVRGHTDDVGKEESNMKLSQNRANAVMAELVKNGVASSRISAVGFGETMPMADNKTAEGRAQNRRVAFDVRQ